MGEFYTRKRLRLKDFDYKTNGMYFITICTKNKKHLFGHINLENDATTILNNNGKTVENHITKIPEVINHTIMPNHIHLILELNNSNRDLYNIIRVFKSYVSKELGFSPWQRSFHDRIIRNEKEFEYIWDYVKHNPERWREDTYFK